MCIRDRCHAPVEVVAVDDGNPVGTRGQLAEVLGARFHETERRGLPRRRGVLLALRRIQVSGYRRATWPRAVVFTGDGAVVGGFQPNRVDGIEGDVASIGEIE